MTITEPASNPISSITTAEPVDSLIVIKSPPKPRRIWVPAILGVIALVGAGIIYYANASALAEATNTPTVALSPSQTATATEKPILVTPGLDSIAILHFRDGNAIMDQAVLEALAMPSPPEGSQYEAWLIGPKGRVSMGILQVDTTGKGSLTYNAAQNENLLALNQQVDIAIKPIDPNSKEPAFVAYSYILPQDGLGYLRQLLVSSPDVPGQSAILQAMSADERLLEQSLADTLNAYKGNDLNGTKRNAEVVLNLLVGKQSPDHKDWNGDQNISNPSDGYGFLFNGNSPGHIQAISSYADFVANSPGASPSMSIHSGEVRACAGNLTSWMMDLKTQMLKIAAAASLTEMDASAQEINILIDQIKNGSDLDQDGTIEPIIGECGTVTLYASAYFMADMPLLPVDNTGTPASGSGVAASPTFKPSGGGGGSTPAPTQKIPPGQNKTKEPKPTNDNGGGGGGGNGNGNKP